MSGEERVARAARRIFRQQLLQAEGSNKTRFGDWHGRLAAELQPEIARMFLSGLKAAQGKAELADWAVSAARERAQLAARIINDTTTQWLQEGREPKDVLGAARAALVGSYEASSAYHMAYGKAADTAGKKLRWVTDGAGKCEECMSLAGKTSRNGKFRGKSGQEYDGPPAHGHCRCKLEAVA